MCLEWDEFEVRTGVALLSSNGTQCAPQCTVFECMRGIALKGRSVECGVIDIRGHLRPSSSGSSCMCHHVQCSSGHAGGSCSLDELFFLRLAGEILSACRRPTSGLGPGRRCLVCCRRSLLRRTTMLETVGAIITLCMQPFGCTGAQDDE